MFADTGEALANDGCTPYNSAKGFRHEFKRNVRNPRKHLLVNTSYEEKGSMAHGEYWTYEERDEEGRLISKIEYRISLGSLTAQNGYRKYDPAGKLIVEKTPL